VPCCRKQDNWFLPVNLIPPSGSGGIVLDNSGTGDNVGESANLPSVPRSAAEAPMSENPIDSSQKPVPLLDLGEELPLDMKDELPYPLQKRLDKCHAKGFMQCV
jgi:hypothetical protein